MKTNNSNKFPINYRPAYREASTQEWHSLRLAPLYGYSPNGLRYESIDADGEIVLNTGFLVHGIVFDKKNGILFNNDRSFHLKDSLWTDSTKCWKLLYVAEYPSVGTMTATLQFILPDARYGDFANGLFSFVDPVTHENYCPTQIRGLLSVRIGGAESFWGKAS